MLIINHLKDLRLKRKKRNFVKIIIKQRTMARPIRNTPALYGKDAERFLAEISKLPSAEERKRERQRIKQSVSDFMSLVARHRK